MIDRDTGITLAGLALVSLGSRVGGYWIFSKMPPSRGLRDFLAYLPVAMFAAVVAPALLQGGPSVWAGAIAATIVMLVWRNYSLAILVGLAGCWAVWAELG